MHCKPLHYMGLSSQLCLGHFTPREGAPSTPWIGGLVGPRANLSVVAKTTHLFITPAGNQTSVIQPIA